MAGTRGPSRDPTYDCAHNSTCDRVTEARKGFLFGLVAYGLWGAFPVYWRLMEPSGALELLSHRVTWSAVFMLALVAGLRRWRSLHAILSSPRRMRFLAVAAVAISVNWGLFIWGVNHDHVV